MGPFKVWILMDADGCYGVGTDAGYAEDDYDEGHGTNPARRLICLNVHVEQPTLTEVDVSVPAELKVDLTVR